ncbi:HAD family hydrolase [Pararhodonellum marinum]|uniref:HAD family hydrolase n=1 Tax=Pararhodonellum marinum TaxID=2755358 RepID=UPI0018903B1A|nr:HAD family phosphatase [Pararhodonellum marinum]
MKKLPGIDFLIFDLGNVIINIDMELTVRRLIRELPESKRKIGDDFYSYPIYADFETGKLDAGAFREKVRDIFQEDWSDGLIDEIWNELLLDIPLERIELLKALKQHYGIFMLSNTNPIHFGEVEKRLQHTSGDTGFDGFFDGLFLSHKMGLKKPDMKIYETVVQQLNTKPEKCLFFDDLEANILAAQKVGIQTHHVQHPKALVNYFQDVL